MKLESRVFGYAVTNEELKEMTSKPHSTTDPECLPCVAAAELLRRSGEDLHNVKLDARLK